ncbi:acyltransferase family protein [Photobacterium satsumensis]|uniref:acyltransferase family protein n=1 Tax=Photobacterium satsumensis TaxID=2910239 RepID=UPI003D12CE3D
MNTHSSNNQLYYLDSLRGIAAICVVISHCFLWFLPGMHTGLSPEGSISNLVFNSPFTFFYKGGSAVLLFFVLSGYVLSFCCISKNLDSGYIQKSAAKRYLRLGIPVAGSIVISYFLVLSNTLIIDTLDLNNISNFQLFYTALKSAIFGAMLYGDGTFNYVLWTISVEYYGSLLVFGFLLLVGNDLYKIRYLSAFIGIALMVNENPMLINYGLFFVGVFLSTFEIRKNNKLSSNVAAISILCLGLYFLGYRAESESYFTLAKVLGAFQYTFNFPIQWPTFIPAVGSILILSTILINDSLLSLLNNRLFLLIGKLSFSIYLLHALILSIVAPKIALLEISNGSKALYSFTITLFLTLIFSFIYYRHVDKRTIRYLKRIY